MKVNIVFFFSRENTFHCSDIPTDINICEGIAKQIVSGSDFTGG